MTQEGKMVQSGIKVNKNTEVMLTLYQYSAYDSAAGTSSLCKADKVLLSDISSNVQVSGDTLPSLENYTPYHEDVDIDSRMELNRDCEEVIEGDAEEEENDHYIVEKIVQSDITDNVSNEFLVKWRGYSETENTWEFAIPNQKLNERINKHCSRSGQVRKRPHFIQTF